MNDPLGLIGTKIDEKYQVDACVGEGGFAVVYKATHLLFKRPVAIKAFRALSDFGPDAREMLVQQFVQEGRLLADLSERSAAIVQARDIGTFTTPKGEWIPYMVLEWLEGAPLDLVLLDERERGLPPRTISQAMQLLEPVAEALAMAHRIGVAHRDIKPANIFILGDPRLEGATVKLLDFGIAKVVQDVQKMGGSFQKTTGQLTSFTPAYGAPEQFSRTHGATGPWTDTFAFALVMTEMMVGKPALDGDSFVQMGYLASDLVRRPTPRSLGAVVTDAVEAVFQRALAVAVDARYQDAGEFWAALCEATGVAPSRPTMFTTGGRTRVSAPSSSGRLSFRPPNVLEAANTVTPESASAAPPLSNTNPKPRGTRVAGVVTVAAVALLLGSGAAIFFNYKGGGSKPAPPASAPSAVASVAPSVPPKPSCTAGMILIEGGEFFMGSNDAKAKDNEKPTHSVKLSPYCIDKTEVTVSAYKACSDGGKCPPAGRDNAFDGLDDSLRKVIDPLCNVREPSAKAAHPINCVDWEMAQNYCTRQGGRLPTEAEWEFAARGPDGRAYPWGDEAPSGRFLNACGKECVAWGKKNKVEGQVTFAQMYPDDDGFPTTAPVGSFPEGKSRYGLEDVVGNVWEWTADFYADYTKDAQVDPKGPKAGEDGRVARGGAWNGAEPAWDRPTFRFHFAPENRSYGVGFRCAADLPK